MMPVDYHPRGETDQELSTTAIRQRVRRTAQRLEDELGEEQDMFIGGCQRVWDQLPDAAAPLIVGIDGGYVHAKDQRSRAKGWFEVIVDMSQDGESSKCFEFGWHSSMDTDAEAIQSSPGFSWSPSS
jgi:hypothetical protein